MLSIANRLGILKLGDKVRIVKSNISVSNVDILTVIGISTNDILFGWKTNDNTPSIINSFVIRKLLRLYDLIENLEQFNQLYWTRINNLDVEYILVTEMKSFGCTCKSCHVYYPDATPNQADNTLVCWSCRNS